MTYKHAPLFALLLLAGCAQDWTPDRSKVALVSAQAASAGVPAAARRAGGGFASAPDRGDLVAYPAQRVVRHDGAYTWHRANLSEAHAVAAIVDGRLSVTAPSGEQLDFVYERHVEHPSGDWTWVGRLENGAASDEIVVTFGEKAAFGTIAQHGGKAPLKLTLQDGLSWLVETDRAKIAGIDNRATRPHADDYLVSPKLPGAPSLAGAVAMAASAPQAEGSTATAGTTIDLLLGYTAGFAAGLGGQSQALTRLNNLVDLTNQSLANAQVAGRVRLVHAMPVDFPDATANRDALEKLTGYKSGTGQIPVDPAFNALRAARDQYGADLVSVVRKFNDPENEGCGIAWMIGGGQSGFHSSDQYFGYSIVADGRDQGADGKTYFCREETLAHELGHNMGSQHDRATATDNGTLKYGAYPYSFGYKTDSVNGNFYTVMAYGDSGQTPYRTFSNPRITFCGGRPCGIADQADVARSLGLTMPPVANFRATVVANQPQLAARGDLNADGRSDVLWRNPNVGLAYWYMNGTAISPSGAFQVASQYEVAGTGDFNGDGRADVLWRNAARTELWLWFSQANGAFAGHYLGGYPAGWEVVGTGDLNADGRTDIVWRNPNVGLAYWHMNGTAISPSGAFNVGGQYEVAGVGDYNGDGRADVLWRNTARTELWQWFAQANGTFAGHYLGGYPAGWEVAGTGDLNADGRADIVWRNPNVGLAYWYMNGTSVSPSGAFQVASQYEVAAVADYNGDGRADVLWRNSARTEVWQWFAQANGGFDARYISHYPAGWEVVGQ